MMRRPELSKDIPLIIGSVSEEGYRLPFQSQRDGVARAR